MAAVFWLGGLAVLGAFYALFCREKWLIQQIREKSGKTFAPRTIAIALLCTTFVGLVSLGVTGSSIPLAYRIAPFLRAKTVRLAFAPQPIRSDEWVVITQMAIGQRNHRPAFPVVNHNLGEEGQNMLVVGMSGVPVRHITQLVKPATWGFYFLDLRRALAWYWWFPIFGCLFALWWLFDLLLPGQWRLGLALSLLFCLSPYCVAWSFWPAYTVFFGAVALCTSMLLLRQNIPWKLGLGVALGLELAGFALVLYPPWQVTLGSLFLAVALGLMVRDRDSLCFNARKIAALGVAVATASAIMLSWWMEANTAILAMMHTVYPGQRFAVGGGMSWPDVLRGYTNLITLYRASIYLVAGFNNESEIASFYYLFLPLAAAIVFRLRKNRAAWELFTAIGLFMIYTLVYMIHGVPRFLAQWTMWKLAPSGRADLALGLAYVLLCGLVLSKNDSEGTRADNPQAPPMGTEKPLVYLIAILWTAVVGYAISRLPNDAVARALHGVDAALLIAVFVSSVWLMLRDVRKFVALSLAMYAATTLPFNPLSIAPRKIDFPPEVRNALSLGGDDRLGYKRVLTLESQIPAMALLSAGIPTVNGVLSSPDEPLAAPWSGPDIG